MSETKICPYPGLRPFTEEESIFFKGRDKHIEEIIHQLEEKKFVMLTGASGDGKSSIVYAGVIPQSRAGFFKAKYNNWLICTFRPERTPMKNMVDSIAKNLQLNSEVTEKELSYGFSALIDLYTSSPYYINEKSVEWQNADDKTRKQLKRKGANLFILVDQFEEFFTNPENYNNGKASVESQTVVNLLLETAKIALAEDIPIHIICTMRSDYIGQCAAFRNLPEFIGFSQFFVPRLKRKEIYDVIEEPAILSGNTISKRLIEVLVNDLREGFDQLPVLQHALNQVWKKADSGNEEMDLIHLAKISGMPAAYLPKQEKEKFIIWYNELLQSQYANIIKTDFENPSLENVLNAHSNELYEKVHEYYNVTNSQDKRLTIEQVKFIIKKVFQCLTKIDDGRAVRSRMTLQEVTDVINDSVITTTEVNYVINIFREQGNTLIYPFITDDNNSRILAPNTVLDITHESLIRNWEILKDWSKEESENYQDYLDFKKQLQRWTDNKKSKNFLLPSGTLVYFMNWFEKCKPNKYWLARYEDKKYTNSEKINISEITLVNTSEFIKESHNEVHRIEKSKKRKIKFYIAAAIFLLIVFASFSFWALRERNKAIEQTKIANDQIRIAKKEKEKAKMSELVANSKSIEANIQTSIADEQRQRAEKAVEFATNDIYKDIQSTLTISADKMNVLYRGIPNPISITVSGVKSENLIVSINNGTIIKVSNGKYEVLPSAGIESTILVKGKTNTGKIIDFGSKKYRVKNIPDPIAKINGKLQGKIAKNMLLKAPGIAADLMDFPFDLKYSVSSYKIVCTVNGIRQDHDVQGNLFTSQIMTILKSLKDSTNVEFTNIQAKGPDGIARSLNSIVFQIIE